MKTGSGPKSGFAFFSDNPTLDLFQGDLPLKDFCATEVEPMFKESDHIHIIGRNSYVDILYCLFCLVHNYA